MIAWLQAEATLLRLEWTEKARRAESEEKETRIRQMTRQRLERDAAARLIDDELERKKRFIEAQAEVLRQQEKTLLETQQNARGRLDELRRQIEESTEVLAALALNVRVLDDASFAARQATDHLLMRIEKAALTHKWLAQSDDYVRVKEFARVVGARGIVPAHAIAALHQATETLGDRPGSFATAEIAKVTNCLDVAATFLDTAAGNLSAVKDEVVNRKGQRSG